MPRRNRQRKGTRPSKKNPVEGVVADVVDVVVLGVVDSIVNNVQLSWVYAEQYHSKPDDKRNIKNTVIEFVRYMAHEGFHDIGAMSIYSTMHKNPQTDIVDHVQVRIYAKDGHRWRVQKGRKDRWGALHIPQDRRLWRPVLFVERNA